MFSAMRQLGWLLIASCILSLPLLALAQSYDFGVPNDRIAPRRSSDSKVVIGRLPGRTDGTVPLRLEIRELARNAEQWELFLLAMNFMQHLDQDDPLSWYQIAGIHGVPFQPWNDVQPVPGASNSGYCTHGSVLFPMWHRPYLALIEQQLYYLVNRIANLYPGPVRLTYQRAAWDFRLPYWDWAARAPEGEAHFPEFFWDARIIINGPRGVQEIKNPLYSYDFHPLDTDVFYWSPLRYWTETKRAPNTTQDVRSAPSNNRAVSDTLADKVPEIQRRLFILFSSYKNYNAFSNKASAIAQGLATYDSIESIHDVVHIYGGLDGHLTYVPLSAFDPLFFFHHVMTDRIIAMWQALNPSAWVSPMAAGETSYTTLNGTIQNSSTPLTPFLIAEDGRFWTSDLSRIPEAFGYSYADTDVSTTPVQQVRQNLARNIISWYGQTSAVGIRDQARYRQGLGTSANRFRTKLKSKYKLDLGDLPVEQIFRNDHYTEWIANVQVNAEALDGKFAIHFFLGEPPTNPMLWGGARNGIGDVPIFAMNRSTGSNSKISGTLPITTALMERVAAGELPNLTPEVVEPYLRQNLTFGVRGSDRAQVSPHRVDGLYIVISSADVSAPAEAVELPSWGPSVRRLTVWS